MRSSASCTSSTSLPVPRAISGMRRLPSASMKSLTMRYSSVFCWPGAFHLQHQAFAQIARADAGRVKGLNDLQHLENLLRRQARWKRPVLRRWL